MGIITPSDLHFERHHGGVPDIDPASYALLIHGMVDRPMVFTLADLEALSVGVADPLPRVLGQPRTHGRPRNDARADGRAHEHERVDRRAARDAASGRSGCSPEATWILAEGGDAAMLTRSVPIDKAMDDALIAYGQNGEAIRPEQGYPARLFLPGGKATRT